MKKKTDSTQLNKYASYRAGKGDKKRDGNVVVGMMTSRSHHKITAGRAIRKLGNEWANHCLLNKKEKPYNQRDKLVQINRQFRFSEQLF